MESQEPVEVLKVSPAKHWLPQMRLIEPFVVDVLEEFVQQKPVVPFADK